MSIVSVVLIVVGLVGLVGGAEFLVRGAKHLAANIGVSPLVVGLTVVSFGTSAPEAAIGVQAALDGETALAMGNIVGSNMFNTLAVLGVSAIIGTLVVHQKLVRAEVPLLVVVSVAVFILGLSGVIGRWWGAVLFLAAIVYTAWAIRREKSEPEDVVAEYEKEFSEPPEAPPHWAVNVAFVVAGLVALVFGSRWLVSGASDVAVGLGMSEVLVGVTIVAVGTSLPELATSVVAAMRGERDIAVGNVMGSNLFNLFVVLGLTALVSPVGVPVDGTVIAFQLPALIFISVLCVGVLGSGYSIRRWEGIMLLSLYLVYLGVSVVETQFTGLLDVARWTAIGAAALATLFVSANFVRTKRRAAQDSALPG